MPSSDAAHLFAGGGERTAAKTLKGAPGFITGFTPVFVITGASAGTVGSFLREYRTEVNIVSGLIVVFFGLNFLGVFKLNLFRGGSKTVKPNNMGFLSALLFGMVYNLLRKKKKNAKRQYACTMGTVR